MPDLVSHPPKLASLFSGCGGMDLGFELAGFSRVFANDFDKDAQAVFRRNLGEIDPRDIRTIPSDDIPPCDVITAGFPCQPFSSAGNRRGVYDRRGDLYLECLRIVGDRKPSVVVFENVKGLLSARHQSGERLIDVIREDLEGLGYAVTYRVVNASDYGVPQNRVRMILVAVAERVGVKFEFPPAVSDRSGLTLANILGVPTNVPNQKHWKFGPQESLMVRLIPEGGSWKDIPYDDLPTRFRKIRDDMKKYHYPKFYRRFGMNEVAGTITASAKPENCGIIHPTEDRRFTIREAARIQTFPDDFVFVDDTDGDVAAMYKVIGNAVPVRLAETIGRAIMEQVFGATPDNVMHPSHRANPDDRTKKENHINENRVH